MSIPGWFCKFGAAYRLRTEAREPLHRSRFTDFVPPAEALLAWMRIRVIERGTQSLTAGLCPC